MAEIKYEGEFMAFLCGFDGEPTVQDVWNAAIKLVEEKFTSTNTARDEAEHNKCSYCGVHTPDLFPVCFACRGNI